MTSLDMLSMVLDKDAHELHTYLRSLRHDLLTISGIQSAGRIALHDDLVRNPSDDLWRLKGLFDDLGGATTSALITVENAGWVFEGAARRFLRDHEAELEESEAFEETDGPVVLPARVPVASARVRDLVARLVGWTNKRAIDTALHSIALAAAHQTALVLCGEDDLVPLARMLHVHLLGGDRPFVVCDPRRASTTESVRTPANYCAGPDALAAAVGGSLCVRSQRLPRDFEIAAKSLQAMHDAFLFVCADLADAANPFLWRPGPIVLPPLASRVGEVPRIIDECVRDACAELSIDNFTLSEADRTWLRTSASASLAEIDKAARRIVALRTSRSTSAAAERLGMAPVSLSRWLQRRRLRT